MIHNKIILNFVLNKFDFSRVNSSPFVNCFGTSVVKKLILFVVIFSVRGFAEEYLPAKIFLVNGKNYECKVSGGDGRIKIRRTLSSGMVATESYRIDKIKSLYLPEPDFLKTNLDVSTVAKLSSAVRIAAAVYKKYKPFIDIKGKTWAAEIGLKSAKLYEQAKNYKKARSLYKKLAKNRKNEEIKNALLLRIGVCTFKLGNYKEAETIISKAFKDSENDSEKAESCYYLGLIYQKRGDHKNCLMTILRNVVFYNREGDWEPKSMLVALKSYKALGDKKAFENTRDRLIRCFPGTKYAKQANQNN